VRPEQSDRRWRKGPTTRAEDGDLAERRSDMAPAKAIAGGGDLGGKQRRMDGRAGFEEFDGR
jgi:hypothetical protein